MRGMPGESQHRYEQAASCSDDPAAAALALRRAAGAALRPPRRRRCSAALPAISCRGAGGGDRAGAARDLAKAAEMLEPGTGHARHRALQRAGRRVAGVRNPFGSRQFGGAGTGSGRSRIPVAGSESGMCGTDPPRFELARRAGEPLIESAALDQLTSTQLALGQLEKAAATALHRTRLLASMPARVDSGMELSDAYHMAAECALAIGDLEHARRLGGVLRTPVPQ